MPLPVLVCTQVVGRGKVVTPRVARSHTCTRLQSLAERPEA